MSEEKVWKCFYDFQWMFFFYHVLSVSSQKLETALCGSLIDYLILEFFYLIYTFSIFIKTSNRNARQTSSNLIIHSTAVTASLDLGKTFALL
jgi:hypothetical protein